MATQGTISVKADFGTFLDGLRKVTEALSKLAQLLAELYEQRRRELAARHFAFGRMLERRDPRWRCECRTYGGECHVVIYKRVGV